MRKALVIGKGKANLYHENKVRDAFIDTLDTCGAKNWQCDIAQIGGQIAASEPNLVLTPENEKEAYDFAVTEGYKIVVESYPKVWERKRLLDHALKNDVWPVQPHGSNISHPPSPLPYPPRLFSAIIVSGGTEIAGNVRSYGPGLEIVSKPPSMGTEQSFAAPSVAAQLALIREKTKYNYWDARAFLRRTPRNEPWSERHGFGFTKTVCNFIDPEELPLYGPVDVNVTYDLKTGYVNVSWLHFKSRPWASTIVEIVEAAGNNTIYNGTEEHVRFRYSGSFLKLRFYSQDSQGRRSRLEDCDFHEIDLHAHHASSPAHSSRPEPENARVIVQPNQPVQQTHKLKKILMQDSIASEQDELGYLHISGTTAAQRRELYELAPRASMKKDQVERPGSELRYFALDRNIKSDKALSLESTHPN